MAFEFEKPEEKAEEYAGFALHYSDNAAKFLKAKEFQKASEMMWGAMASILKAVAARKGVSVKSHKELWQFARKLSKEEQNPEIFNSFSKASNLHQNFYESNIGEIELRALTESVAKTIGLLMEKLGYRPR